MAENKSIEVTQEMANAGAAVIDELMDVVTSCGLAREVYRAMVLASSIEIDRASPPTACL